MTEFSGVDGSTTVTTGATAQYLFGGKIPPHGYEIWNPDATEVLWISETGVAVANDTGAIRVNALTGYSTPPNYMPFGPVSVIGATTGHKITARMW